MASQVNSTINLEKGFSHSSVGKESADQGRVHKTCQSLGWEDPLEEKWHLTPAFLLGESHGQRSLMSYDSSGHKKLDPAEHLRT